MSGHWNHPQILPALNPHQINGHKTLWPPPIPFTSQISSTAQSAIPPSKAPGPWTIRKTRNIPDTLTSCVNLPLIFFKTLLKCPLRVMLSLDMCLNHLSLSFSHTHTLQHCLSSFFTCFPILLLHSLTSFSSLLLLPIPPLCSTLFFHSLLSPLLLPHLLQRGNMTE